MAPEKEVIDLARYRLDKAKNMIEAARHAMSVEDCLTAVISKFRELYIKTGLFDVHYSQIIADSFEIRNHSDYDDFYAVGYEDANLQITNAELFLIAIRNFIEEREGMNRT